MEFKELSQQAKEIKEKYAVLNRTEGFEPWGLVEYMQGFVGDVGDLGKLIMAKEGHRFADQDIDQQLAKELADCLYGIISIAAELNIELEEEFKKTMEELRSRIAEREVILKSEEAL